MPVGRVELKRDKHATRELDISVDNYKGLRGALCLREMSCVPCTNTVKQSLDSLDSISKQRVNKAVLSGAVAMLSTDFIQLLKENLTCTNKAVMTCYIGAQVIKGKFI